MKKLNVIVLLLFSLNAYAYRPRLVFGQDLSIVYPKIIQDPEISQTFYGELIGKADYYKINSSQDFELYLNIMEPDIPEAYADFSVDVYSDNKNISLDGTQFEWEKYTEKLTGNYLLKGPSYEEIIPSGDYLIQVSNPDNLGKYVLVIGKINRFSVPDAINTVLLMPKIRTFFQKSPITAYFNQIGLILFIIFIIIFVVIAFIIYYRQYMRQIDYRWFNSSSVNHFQGRTVENLMSWIPHLNLNCCI